VNTISTLEAWLLRRIGSIIAAGGNRASLLILIYHRVLAAIDPLLEGEPDAPLFAAQMDVIKSVCNVLPLAEAVDRLYRGSLPPRAVSITFDDGYANNHSIAAPILKARGLPATVFVASGFTGNGRMFNDTVIEAVRRAGPRLDLTELGLGSFELPDMNARRRAIGELLGALKYRDPAQRLAQAQAIAERVGAPLPEDLMMSQQQLRELAGYGIDIGAHTVTHPILRSVDEQTARREIAESKATLEAISGQPVTSFAYPNGRPTRDYDATHVALVRATGFKAAVSTAWGAAGRQADRYQLPRMLPWDPSALRFGARLLRTYRERSCELA
jgi:peptidoglycan/xylan/chitin deacetylase (PgdA/CDA1 family)